MQRRRAEIDQAIAGLCELRRRIGTIPDCRAAGGAPRGPTLLMGFVLDASVAAAWALADEAHPVVAFTRSSAFADRVDRAPDEMAVLTLARRYGLTIYDASYLELAERLVAPLATLVKLAQARRENIPLSAS